MAMVRRAVKSLDIDASVGLPTSAGSRTLGGEGSRVQTLDLQSSTRTGPSAASSVTATIRTCAPIEAAITRMSPMRRSSEPEALPHPVTDDDAGDRGEPQDEHDDAGSPTDGDKDEEIDEREEGNPDQPPPERHARPSIRRGRCALAQALVAVVQHGRLAGRGAQTGSAVSTTNRSRPTMVTSAGTSGAR